MVVSKNCQVVNGIPDWRQAVARKMLVLASVVEDIFLGTKSGWVLEPV